MMEYPAYLQQHLKARSPGQTISLDLSLSKVPIGALVFMVVSRAYRSCGVKPLCWEQSQAREWRSSLGNSCARCHGCHV